MVFTIHPYLFFINFLFKHMTKVTTGSLYSYLTPHLSIWEKWLSLPLLYVFILLFRLLFGHHSRMTTVDLLPLFNLSNTTPLHLSNFPHPLYIFIFLKVSCASKMAICPFNFASNFCTTSFIFFISCTIYYFSFLLPFLFVNYILYYFHRFAFHHKRFYFWVSVGDVEKKKLFFLFSFFSSLKRPSYPHLFSTGCFLLPVGCLVLSLLLTPASYLPLLTPFHLPFIPAPQHLFRP